MLVTILSLKNLSILKVASLFENIIIIQKNILINLRVVKNTIFIYCNNTLDAQNYVII